MKMKKITKVESIETHLDDQNPGRLDFGYWDCEKNIFIPLTEDNAADFGIPVNLVGIMEMFANEITEKFCAVNRDLKELGAEILK